MSTDSRVQGVEGGGGEQELRLIFKVCSAPTDLLLILLLLPTHCTPILCICFSILNSVHAPSCIIHAFPHRWGILEAQIPLSAFAVCLLSLCLFVCCVVCVFHTFMQINAEYHSHSPPPAAKGTIVNDASQNKYNK